MKLTKPITVMRGLKARPLSSGLVCLDIKDTADPVALKVKRAEAAATRLVLRQQTFSTTE